ncbi:hypothetical protein SBA6_680027 [Candidatus Sulfopaludibacter sp. SbA6]|nr:hypothetical protein SBA6_680027 [Candidatus Sulfopaludibacter sp. SbA6]
MTKKADQVINNDPLVTIYMPEARSKVKGSRIERGHREQLASVLKDAIKRSGRKTAEIARESDIDRTHLYHVLSTRKSLSDEKLIALARTLRIPPETLLGAAGHAPSPAAAFRVDILRAGDIQRLDAPLRVITDPRFFDSAFFLWLLGNQPLRPTVVCDLRCERWPDVHAAVGTADYALGFYNRRSILTLSGKPIYDVRYWSDLSFYKGYALIARKGDAKPPTRLEGVQKLLAKLAENGRNKIISMGADTVWALRTPLVPELAPGRFDVQVVPNPDYALDRFLDGMGNLFVGGLPQRLKAKSRGCVEVMNSDLNPLLFSFNSLICSKRLYEQHQAVLAAVTSLWFTTIAQMRSNGEFREYVKKSILALLDQLGIEDHSLTPEGFDEVFGATQGAYEVFPETPSGLVDCYADMVQRVMNLIADGDIPSDAIPAISAAMMAPLRLRIETEQTGLRDREAPESERT